MSSPRHILVTAGLPYANGSIHLGHLVEYIQTDIWCRFQRLMGNECFYICGDDTHGTAIMLAAQKQGITPEALIAKVHEEHFRDLTAFHIQFADYYTTHSEENKTLACFIYEQLKKRGDISSKKMTQFFDEKENIFLPDRFIKGECPRCGAKDQYGDNCENCGATYSPQELKNPVSVISGTTPVEKESEHYFFDLAKYADILKEWMKTHHLQDSVVHKLNEWFEEGLKDWNISRDAPYFGFEIPGAPKKYFYVWMDAPVGYMSTFKHFCNSHSEIKFENYWNSEQTELYHFIGKDIMYFHTLFWPAMLHGAGFRMPTSVFVHGFLTINGTKMSKSRGTFITAQAYLNALKPEFLRYYFAAKLTPQVDDIDLNFEDFTLRVNSDLVGKFVNLASRCAGFITKKFEGKLAKQLQDENLFTHFVEKGKEIAENYESLNYNRAMRDIMQLADEANKYIDEQKPWSLAKDETQSDKVQLICTQGLNLFKLLATYLKPVLPDTAKNIEEFLAIEAMDWKTRAKPMLNHTIHSFKPLMQRVQKEAIDALVKAT